MVNLALIVALLITVAVIGGCAPAGAQEGEGTSIIPLIIFIVLIFGMFYLIIIRPQRRRQKEHQEVIAQIKRGDKVITAGGVYGVIESTSDDSVVIKVESGATLRVAKGSIVTRREK